MQPNELDTLKAKVEEMKKEIERLEAKEWPKEHDIYFYINSDGKVFSLTWDGDTVDFNMQNFLGIFRTKEEAELKLRVIKALCPAKPFVPEEGEKYYLFGANRHQTYVDEHTWDNDSRAEILLSCGNCFPHTPEGKEACEKYGEVLSKYAESLIKQ